MSKAKGDRRERDAEAIYEAAGFRPWRPARSRAGKNDLWGLFDMAALGPKGLDLVQIKANGARGIQSFCEATQPFQERVGLSPVMLVCHDGQGGHDPTPASWRVLVPTGETYSTVVDEREDGTPADGEGVQEWLETPKDRKA